MMLSVFRFFTRRRTRADVSPLLRCLAEQGGAVGENDPGLAPFADMRDAAEDAGLISAGGGWGTGYRLTKKGRHTVSPLMPR